MTKKLNIENGLHRRWNRSAGYNDSMTKVAFQFTADSFVVAGSILLRFNFCGRSATFTKPQIIMALGAKHALVNRPSLGEPDTKDMLDCSFAQIDTAEGGSILAPVLGSMNDEEEQLVDSFMTWMRKRGLPEGEKQYELIAPDGALLAVLDLAWPDGIQTQLTPPAALILNENEAIERLLNHHGYRFFTEVEGLKRYVETEILVMEDQEERMTMK